MALYHFSAKIISRGKGESACAAAAYRSATKITNEYDGQVHDYRRKQSVVFSTILLPDNAPGQYADRATLWNAVEAEEKQSNAQLAREIEFALPWELDEKTRERIALEFIQDTFVNEGMIADVNFHNPPKKDSRGRPVNAEGHITRNPDEFIYTNPHVHVQVTIRPIDASGKWENKKQKLYVVEKNGERQALTNDQIKEDPGWEKLYSFSDSEGRKIWVTKSYAKAHPELTQVNRYPKAVSVLNPKVEQWNSSDTLRQWRAAWADKVNTTFLEIGISEHIDHRSYADQGLDLVPTVHLEKQAMTEEKRLQEKSNTHTDLYMLNQAI
jgi:ATP-dependent exoDNAse (exonuclease V) alpha subunit